MGKDPTVPPELERYRGKFERAARKKSYAGIFAHSYDDLYALLSIRDISDGELADWLALSNRSASSTVRKTRSQFFPTILRRSRGRLAAGERERRNILRTERYLQMRDFQLLGKYLRLVGLEGRLVPTSGLPALCTIGRVRCAVHRKTVATNNGTHVQFCLSKACVDFEILLTDIEGDGPRYHEIYCVATESIPHKMQSVYIRIHPERRRGGPYPKVDAERYRGAEGLAILKAMVNQLDNSGA